MFGKLERVGEFESQVGKARQAITLPPLNGADATTAPKGIQITATTELKP